MVSCTPVTVTVCSVSQFAAVKLKTAGKAVPSLGSWLITATATAADGSVNSFTVKVAVPPASVAWPHDRAHGQPRTHCPRSPRTP